MGGGRGVQPTNWGWKEEGDCNWELRGRGWGSLGMRGEEGNCLCFASRIR